jgi:hypothetical protein
LAPGKKNYFIGRDPKKWQTSVPLYFAAKYHDVYPGVNVAFRGMTQQLEFDFLVRPGANPKKITLAFQGAGRIETSDAGDLILSTASGELRFRKPVAYQVGKDGKRQPVEAKFVLGKNQVVGFSLGAYDPRRELVVDPPVFATYLGGSLQDEALGIAIDSSTTVFPTGAVYVTGATTSLDFPQVNQQFPFTGTVDSFVTALNPAGTMLLFSTYFGGSDATVARAIAVADNQQIPNPGVFITGYSNSPDLPIFPPVLGYAGGQDAFLWELSLDGTNPLGGTYLGGTADDFGTAVTFDNQGNVWVAGQTFSSDFPVQQPLTTPDESQINLGQGTGPADAFVAQLSATFGINFATYFGGSKQDFADGIAISDQTSPTYDVYFAGGTNSPDLFATPGAVQPTCGNGPVIGNTCDGGNDDAFVAAIAFASVNGSASYTLKQSTYLGGSGQDDAYAVALDESENVYVTGETNSPAKGTQPFPTSHNAYQNTLKGINNAFFSELDPTGSTLLYSTYFGGSGKDAGLGIVLDGINNVYLTGRTNSLDFPTVSPTQATIGGRQDAFVSALEPSNGKFVLGFSTYLGGSGDENLVGGAIAVDDSQHAYIAGDTNSGNFPVTAGVVQSTFNGSGSCTITTEVPPGTVSGPCEDAFITKIQALNNPTLTVQLTGSGTATVTSTPPGIDCNFQNTPCPASFPFGTQVTLSETTVSTTFNGWSGGGCSGAGSCAVTVTTDQQVTADFSINVVNQTLSVNFPGNGMGTVTSMPTGANCTSPCTPLFAQGTVVTLTATPNANSTFVGWGGACSDAGSCVVTMSADMIVSANFMLKPFPVLTVGVLGTGGGLVTSSPPGISCSTPACMQAFPPGTMVTLSAEAVVGSAFAGWGGACSGAGGCIVTMNSNQVVTATFNALPIARLSVNLQGMAGGSVASNPVGISCPGMCSDTFMIGTSVTLTATPDNGSMFFLWGEAANKLGCYSDPICTVTFNQPGKLTFSADFELPGQPGVIVALSGGGSGSVKSSPSGIDCPGTCGFIVPLGSSITLTAMALDNASFTGWGGACSGTETCQLTIDSNSTTNVIANFIPVAVTSTLSVLLANTGIGMGTVTSNTGGINCSGTGTGTCSTTFAPQTIVTLTATPGSGSTFTGWSGGANAFGCFTVPTCTITIGQNSVQVTAGFDQPVPVPPPFTLTISPSENAVVPSGSSTAYGLNMLSENGFVDTVSLTCSVRPATPTAPTCSLNPSTVNLGANQGASSTLTINAFTTTALWKRAPFDKNRYLPLYTLSIPLLGIVFLNSRLHPNGSSRKKKVLSVFGALFLLGLAVQLGCGGGSSKASGSTSNAQAGTYTVTVVATGATSQVQETTVVSITVQ